MGFYLNKKEQLSNPSFSVFQASAVDLSGRPSLKSADRMGRLTCTDVHALTWQMAERPTQLTRTESSALCSFGSTGRLTGGSNGRIFDRWRSTGRSTDRSDRPQRLVSGSLYIEGLVIVFGRRFWRLVEPVFPILLEEFFLHIFEGKYFQSKGKNLSRVFKVIL